jgi:HEAT repeat protein
MTARLLAALAVAAITSLVGLGNLRAEGVADMRQLDAKQRGVLIEEIAKARARQPAAFAAIAKAPSLAIELDRNKRGRFAAVGPELRRLGRPALLPMLEMLALSGPRRADLNDSAWRALRVGLIEAVGTQREPIAQPVLNAILDGDSDYWVVRAAAEAIGRYGDDASVKKLIALARAAGPKRDAVLSAIGNCRRRAVVEQLAEMLAAPANAAQAERVIDALGDAGNSWAWRTPNVAKYGEESAVRGAAARALVAAFVKFDGRLRLRARRAILLVDHGSTPALIAAARVGAPPDTRAALDELAVKLAKNPLRR